MANVGADGYNWKKNRTGKGVAVSIRLRLSLLFSACLLPAFLCLSLIVLRASRETSRRDFSDMPAAQLQPIEERINAFLASGFMANLDSQYTQPPAGRHKDPGYDPRKRSWFGEIMQSRENAAVRSPYRTTGADVVCGIRTRTFDPDDQPLRSGPRAVAARPAPLSAPWFPALPPSSAEAAASRGGGAGR